MQKLPKILNTYKISNLLSTLHIKNHKSCLLSRSTQIVAYYISFIKKRSTVFIEDCAIRKCTTMRETDKEAADWLNLGIVQVKYLCKICAKKACSYSNFLLNSFVRNISNPSSIHIDKYIDSFRKKIPKNLVRYFRDLDY